MDDLLTGEDDDRTFEVYENSKKLMSQGGFNLWNSNSRTLLAKIKEAEGQTAPVEASNPSAVSEEDESYAKAKTSSNSMIGEEKESYTKLLGVIWDSQSYQFTFDFSELITYITKLPVTKQSLLKFTGKIFDLLGFLSSFVVCSKMMFQVLCTANLSWDNPIQGNMLKTWNSILSENKALNGIKIPITFKRERRLLTFNFTHSAMHQRKHMLQQFMSDQRIAMAMLKRDSLPQKQELRQSKHKLSRS